MVQISAEKKTLYMIYVTFVTKRKKYLKRNENENVIVKTRFLVRRVMKIEM